MVLRKAWLKGSKAEQIVWMQNYLVKLPNYQTALGLTSDELTAALALALEFVAVMSEVDQCQTTMKAMNEWRDATLWGPFTDKDSVPAPVFPSPGTPTVKEGIYEQISKFRDQCMANAAFTVAMGEDIGFLGQQETPLSPELITPDFRVSTAEGYTIMLAGSMQGFDAVRVQYAPKGGSYSDIGFLTNTPGGVQVTPINPGDAETGHVRTVFVRKNANVGNFSPEYPVTLS